MSMDVKVGNKLYSVEKKYGVVLPRTTLDVSEQEEKLVAKLASIWPNLLVELYLSAHNGQRLTFADVLVKVKEVAFDRWLGEELSIKEYGQLISRPFDPRAKETGWFHSYLMSGDVEVAKAGLGMAKAS